MHMAPIEAILINDKYHVRTKDDDYRKHIESLADSIAKNGFLKEKPLAVIHQSEPSEIFVIDGLCRLLAARRANERGDGEPITELPVIFWTN